MADRAGLPSTALNCREATKTVLLGEAARVVLKEVWHVLRSGTLQNGRPCPNVFVPAIYSLPLKGLYRVFAVSGVLQSLIARGLLPHHLRGVGLRKWNGVFEAGEQTASCIRVPLPNALYIDTRVCIYIHMHNYKHTYYI